MLIDEVKQAVDAVQRLASKSEVLPTPLLLASAEPLPSPMLLRSDVHDAASLYLPLHDEFTPDLPAWTEGTALEFTPPLDGAATPPPHAARQPSRQDMLQMIQDAANSVMIQAATGSVPAPAMAPA